MSEENKELSLTEEEIANLNALRQRVNALGAEIGGMEIRKARLIGAVSAAENQANQLLQSVAERLGIEDGVTWQVTPEGKVILPKDEDESDADADAEADAEE